MREVIICSDCVLLIYKAELHHVKQVFALCKYVVSEFGIVNSLFLRR